ncbi:elongation factor P hydroxylase [Teredinibacter turnerae]|uniref:elongation factor P hydroxylase n=1 Tax=Teredinibacter turnerae TaxID=2426 RepID=UPI000360BFCF|nr:elongation factor P hydroxylase [Teredinibacter turnerae]
MSCITIIHSAAVLVELFNQCFLDSEYNTCLEGQGEEPIYLPRGSGRDVNTIVFTQDYFSSALHEVSHWCIAGPQRLSQVDYGYWYAPDGRSAAQQALFEKVEVKPQALEWIFHKACACRFRVSADNLMAGMGASSAFKRAILAQVHAYCATGLQTRAKYFAAALARYFGGENYLDADAYSAQELDSFA